MDKISVRVLRDLANNPSIVEIIKNNRKITATFDPNIGLVLVGPSGQLPSVAEILQMAYPFEMPSFARPAWHDRNPKTIIGRYTGEKAPHAQTERTKYTCPEDRKCMIEAIFLSIDRTVADGTATEGQYRANFYLTLPDATFALLYEVKSIDNTVGTIERAGIGTSITLLAGDVFWGFTRDQSGDIASRIYYDLCFKGTEFDA